ncbi:MAG: bifunctional 4-hydroxy-2-oxoglutarate aldolase/2-dehydro-3-deoxy-phosphogluconate aldolase [Candidatus Lokiarchaeota archaeon]|nr:bifunctional 4-hydroxy-2-oxoglutarate aldolase/2-dehydro-3-deoxy-phosphogluconate aldolase [Candidatus Lokiarchaeota archaeon]
MKKIEELRLIPVVIIENSENAIPLGQALIEAGLPIIEITFRTQAAEESISDLTKKISDLFVGAGTVLKIDQVKKAVNAGAQFIVTPGFNPKIVDYCIDNKIPIIPGVNTPSMVEWALDKGLKVVKFFPANLSGGPKMLKSLAGPYPEMRFIPTGGINNECLIDYLKLSNVFACGGSWIVKKDLISSGQFEEIRRLTNNALSLIKSEIG